VVMGPDFLVGEEVVRGKCRCFIVASGLSAIVCVIATSHCTLIATAIFEVICLNSHDIYSTRYSATIAKLCPAH
jgi:hypothetical protein